MTITLDHQIAGNVRAEAARRMVQQKELAAALRLSRQQLGRRWAGETPWSGAELAAIATLLDIEPSQLLAHSEGLEPPTFCFGVTPRWVEHVLAA